MTTICQGCGSTNLTPVFFAGWLPPVNTFEAVDQPPWHQTRYPARLLRCGECTLVQMEYRVPQEILFPKSYSYRSGTTRLLRENFHDLATEAPDLLGRKLVSTDLVVDIASNDGTMLEQFQMLHKCRVQGVEPTNARQVAESKGIPTLPEFWDVGSPNRIIQWRGKAAIITACNVFAHVPHTNLFLAAVKELLLPDGLLVLENHHLPEMLKTLQYDTVYHEHLRYYSLTSLSKILNAHGLAVVHVKPIPTHGGGLRVYVRRQEDPCSVNPSVGWHLDQENVGLDLDAWQTFRSQVNWTRTSLWRMIDVMKRSDSRIYGVGCPSRAVTLLHYCGLDDGILDCVCEIEGSPKIGHYVPGTLIPVVDEERLYREQPDFCLILSWHLAMELAIKLRVRGYKGRFITPLPEPKILEGV